MPELEPTEVGVAPTDLHVQQLISAEKGDRGKGIPRTWRAPLTEPDDRVILVVDAAGGIALSRDGGATPPTPPIVDGTAAGGGLSGTYPNPTLAAATVAGLIPAGVIWAYGGAGAPPGWLVCDGQPVGRAAYPALFAAIGTAYNVGGEAGAVFRLPDLRDRVLLGASATHPLGSVGTGAHAHATDIAHDHLTVHPTPTSPVDAASLSDTHQPAAVGFKAVGLDHWHSFDVPALPTTQRTSSPPVVALPPFTAATYIIRTGL